MSLNISGIIDKWINVNIQELVKQGRSKSNYWPKQTGMNRQTGKQTNRQAGAMIHLETRRAHQALNGS